MHSLRGAASAMALAGLLGMAVLAATPATAAAPGQDYVFNFSAYCTDCSAEAGDDEFGVGVLTLKDVTDLSSISAANFVGFTYASYLLTLDLTVVTSLSADFSDLSAVDLDLVATGQSGSGRKMAAPRSWELITSLSAEQGEHWTLALPSKTPHPADFGTTYSWTASGAPEPAAWALMIAGLGLSGVRLRNRRRAAPAT